MQTLYDPITRLPGSELFAEILRYAIKHNRRNDRLLALVRLSLGLSHSGEGELSPEFLQVGAARIKNTIRENDLIGYLGNGEFAIVFSDLITPGDVDRAMQRLFEDFKTPFDLNGCTTGLTAKAGISLCPINGNETDSLMHQAGQARLSLESDRVCHYRYFGTAINRTAIDRMALAQSMEEALSEKQFKVFYLPQFDLATETLTGVEALLKWRHPQLGLLPAKRWVPLADELNKMGEISKFVLETVAADDTRWREKGAHPIDLMVNFCTSECLDQSFAKDIRRILDAVHMHPRRFVFEFSEDCIGYQATKAWQSLVGLDKMGIRISIDNYGTGYTNVIQLKNWPLNHFKIDRSLISGIIDDEHTCSVVKALIDLGHALKLRVAASGAETARHLEILKALGCDLVQGFALCRPCESETIEPLLLPPCHTIGA